MLAQINLINLIMDWSPPLTNTTLAFLQVHLTARHVAHWNGQDISHFENLAGSGDAEAHLLLMLYYEFKITNPDRGLSEKTISLLQEKRLHYFKHALALSHPHVLFLQANRHYYGTCGEVRDALTAFRWYQMAAEKGHPMAHHCLGSLLHYGDGVPMDKTRAFQCFKFAANNGIPDSQYALGMILSKGEGCVKDINEGIRWLEASALQPFALHAAAMAALGDLYFKGDGDLLPRDLTKALNWSQAAALRGVPDAGFRMAVLSLTPDDALPPPDLQRALIWFSQAAAAGHTNARRYFDRLQRVRSTEDAVAIVMQLQSEDLGIDHDLQFAEAMRCVDGRGKTLTERETDMRRAHSLLESLAERGHAASLYQLSLLHLHGQGLPKRNPHRALSLCHEAACRGFIEAKVAYGVYFHWAPPYDLDWANSEEENEDNSSNESGLLSVDMAQARQWLSEAADMGSAPGQYNLALLCLKGEVEDSDIDIEEFAAEEIESNRPVSVWDSPIAKDRAKALSLLHSAADKGHSWAQTSLAQLYADPSPGRDPVPPMNPALALHYFKLAAAQGEYHAQEALAWAYYRGNKELGIERDLVQALRTFELLANSANPVAQYCVAQMYLQGEGVFHKDPARAAMWFKLAAEQSNMNAQVSLATLYLQGAESTIEGTAVAKDVTKAWYWYKLAATKGHIVAQYQLALLLLDDSLALQQSDEALSVEERRVEALSWLTKSAIQGYTLAMYQLGLWKLTELDENTARYWLERAAEEGHAYAADVLQKVSEGSVEDVTQSITVTRNVFDECVSRAEGGEAEAQYRVAQMFFFGVDSSAVVPLLNRSESHSTTEGRSAFTLKRDGVKALHWCRIAAEQGYPPAERMLGMMYLNGEMDVGLIADRETGKQWLEKAANHGDVRTQFFLAESLLQLADKESHNKAVEWLMKVAAEHEEPQALLKLGILHYEGDVVERDVEASELYLLRAEKAGHPKAKLLLGCLYADLSEDADDSTEYLQRAIACFEASRDTCYSEASAGIAELLGRLDPSSVAYKDALMASAEAGVAEAWITLCKDFFDDEYVATQWNVEHLVMLRRLKGSAQSTSIDEETKRLEADLAEVNVPRHSREVRDCPLCGLDAQKHATVSAAMDGGGAVLPWTLHVNPLCFTHSDTSMMLGEGAFGKAIRATLHSHSRDYPVALKSLKLRRKQSLSTAMAAAMREEMMTMRLVADSQFITRCFGHTVVDGEVCLVMELAPYGSLLDILKDWDSLPTIPLVVSVQWMRDIASALRDMHRFHVKHLDVKPANVLVFGGLRAKLTDLGLARKEGFTSVALTDKPDDGDSDEGSERGDSGKAIINDLPRKYAHMDSMRSTAGIGTDGYMAPEIIDRLPATMASDVFSLGVTCAHIVTRKAPPRVEWSACVRESLKRLRDINSETSLALAEMISSCCKIDKDKRPTASACVAQLQALLDSITTSDESARLVFTEVEETLHNK